MTTSASTRVKYASGMVLLLAAAMSLAVLTATVEGRGAWLPSAVAALFGLVLLFLSAAPRAVLAAVPPVSLGLLTWQALTVDPDGALLVLFVLPVLWAATLLPARATVVAVAAGLLGLGAATVRGVEDLVLWGSASTVVLAVSVTVRMLRRRVRDLEHLDHVTGLPNARAWHRALERETRRALRHEYPLTLVLLDLDGFGDVNRTQGHEAGDLLLRQVAVAIADAVRATDVVARLSADTFGVMLVGTRSKGAARSIERLREASPSTFSAAVVPWDGKETLEELMRLAHRTLAAAVADGPSGEKLAPVLERAAAGAGPRA